MTRWPTTLVLVATAVVLAACGGAKAASSTTTPSSSSTSTTAVKSVQRLTVTPSHGLHSGERVQLKASGFSAKETLGVIECANKGTHTTEGDCDVANLEPVSSNGKGDVTATYTVTKGPFGAHHVVCTKPASCIVSITQESPSPTQDATAPLTFS